MPASLTITPRTTFTFDSLACDDLLPCDDTMPCSEGLVAPNTPGVLTATVRTPGALTLTPRS